MKDEVRARDNFWQIPARTASGILSFALGVMLLLQLPQASVWFIGLAVGVDALFDGIGLVSFALAVHRLPVPPDQKFA